MTIIVKNTTIVDKNWGGNDVPASSQYDIQEVDRLRFLSDDLFLSDLISGDAVINNGTDDLSANLGLLCLQRQLVFTHEDMDIYPSVGANAAEAVKISSAAAGFRFAIGDEMFSQGRLDDIVGDGVEFEAHWSIDNAVADRWVAFEISLITTTGGGDKTMDTPDIVAVAGPFLVPTTPNEIFRLGGVLPVDFFANGEKYIFMGIKRIDVADLDKTGPVNDPILYRVCKIYARRLDQ